MSTPHRPADEVSADQPANASSKASSGKTPRQHVPPKPELDVHQVSILKSASDLFAYTLLCIRGARLQLGEIPGCKMASDRLGKAEKELEQEAKLLKDFLFMVTSVPEE